MKLLEIVKNHLKIEKYLIEKGNDKRIIKYVRYSYKQNFSCFNELNYPYPSFPFSCNTISQIIEKINVFFWKNIIVNYYIRIYL